MSILTLGVHFFIGMLLVLGQLLPSGGALQIASGEALPQSLLWLLVGALLATDHLLTRYVSVQGRILAAQELGTNYRDRIWPCLLGFGLLASVSQATYNVYGHGNFRYAVNGCWQWYAWAVAVVVLWRVLSNPRVFRGVLKLMIVLAWLSAIHGFYQVLVSLPVDRERFRENPRAVLLEAGIDAPVGSSTYQLFEQRLQDDSPTGPFALTNSLAGFLVPWILILIASILHSKSWSSDERFRQLFRIVVVIFLSVCLLWTKSRTAWVALGVGGLAIAISNRSFFRQAVKASQGFWFGDEQGETIEHSASASDANLVGFRWQRTLVVCVGFMLVIGAILLGLQAWDPKLLNEASRSLAFRSEYWRTTMRLVADHPWFGIGPGNFQSYYAAYKPELESETIADPHNFLLETLATAGWPALLFLVGLIVWLAKPYFASFADVLVGENSAAETQGSASSLGSSTGAFESNAIFLGAIVGALAIWFGSGALGSPPDVVPYMFAIPLVVVLLLFDFILSKQRGSRSVIYFPRAIGFGPALIAMGVHLLASGGWMTPGIGNTIAILVAGLWMSSDKVAKQATSDGKSPSPSVSNSEYRMWQATSGFALALVAWLLLVAFYITAWLPKQRMQEIETAIAKQGSGEAILKAYQEADPWNPMGYRILADLQLAQVERELTTNANGGAPSIDRFRETAKKYLASNRANSETWSQLGHWELAISLGRKESLNRALEYYREASQQAPGDVGLLTQVALAAWLAEDMETVRVYLEKAVKIDTNVTHPDRKLARAMLYWPANVGPPSTRVAPMTWQSARESTDLARGWVRAEPVSRLLRSQLDSARTRTLR